MSGDRLSIKRSQYDTEPEGEPPHLVDFIIRGPRGRIKGHVCVDHRLALRYWRDLGVLLGESLTPKHPQDEG